MADIETCTECGAVTQFPKELIPHKGTCSQRLYHGMSGSSTTHCCYKHEFKDAVRDRPAGIIRDLLNDAANRAAANEFQAIDEMDALIEILKEQSDPTVQPTNQSNLP